MTDHYDLTDDQLTNLLKRGAQHLWIAEGIADGFTAERAATLLASDELLAVLRRIGHDMAPGPGFLDAAMEDTERGALNRRLLRHVLRDRPSGLPVVVDGDQTTVGPRRSGLPEVALASLALDGGTVAWDVENLEAPSTITFAGEAPSWVAELLGPRAAGLLAAGAARVPERPFPHPLQRYALAGWLKRWHPGSDDGERPFDEVLLDAEIRELLTEFAPVFPGLSTFPQTAVRVSERREFALAAGEDVVGVAATSGLVVVDPALVPARCVAPGGEGVWEVIDDAEPTLRVHVPLGDSPVDGLTAHCTVDGKLHTVGLLPDGAAYSGSLALNWMPDEVAVQVTARGTAPSGRSVDEIAATWALLIDVARTRREVFGGGAEEFGPGFALLADRPFRCELASWEPR